jgi:hypothetical protein
MRERDEEVEEFNAGYECAKGGGIIDDEPEHCPQDQWRIGFQAGAYDGLVKEIKESII